MIVCTETVFTLHTTHTSYQLAVAPNGMVLHTYYGTRLPEDVPSLADARMPHSDPGCWPDLLPQELSGCGTADNRTPAVIPEYADGTEAAAFVFDHAVVTPGKPQLPGLPMFRTGEGVETLSVFLKDAGGLVVELRYSVYEAEDLITRTAVYTNAGTQSLTLHKAASLSVDFAPDALELITLNGTWAAERTLERAALRCGIQSIGSMRGVPGHAHNPAVALCHADTNETTGDAWGFAFVYSGNYLIEAERCDAGERLVMGIHPYHFHWTLAHGALLRGGELHRLVNPDANGLGAAWMLSAKDGSEAAVFAVGDALTGSHGTASLNARPRLVLAGLDPAAQYRDEENNTYTGAQLLTTGLELPGGYGQMPAKIWYLKKV